MIMKTIGHFFLMRSADGTINPALIHQLMDVTPSGDYLVRMHDGAVCQVAPEVGRTWIMFPTLDSLSAWVRERIVPAPEQAQGPTVGDGATADDVQH